MSQCGVCEQDKPIGKKYQVYTGIKVESSVKVGFKEYQTLTKTGLIKKHEYTVCPDCEKKYGRDVKWILVGIAILLAIGIAIGTGILGNPDNSFWDNLFYGLCFSPFVVIPLWAFIYIKFYSIGPKLSKKAVAARDSTNWKLGIAKKLSLPNHEKHGRYFLPNPSYSVVVVPENKVEKNLERDSTPLN